MEDVDDDGRAGERVKWTWDIDDNVDSEHLHHVTVSVGPLKRQSPSKQQTPLSVGNTEDGVASLRLFLAVSGKSSQANRQDSGSSTVIRMILYTHAQPTRQ